jgi:hypothetical protein
MQRSPKIESTPSVAADDAHIGCKFHANLGVLQVVELSTAFGKELKFATILPAGTAHIRSLDGISTNERGSWPKEKL